jgi:hypothetical protein
MSVHSIAYSPSHASIFLIDEPWEQVPEMVIEIVSLGYEEKDLSINPPWNLSISRRAGCCAHRLA